MRHLAEVPCKARVFAVLTAILLSLTAARAYQAEEDQPSLYGSDGPPPFFDYDCDVAASRHAVADWNEIYRYLTIVTEYDIGNYTFELAYLPFVEGPQAAAALEQCPIGVLALTLLRFYQLYQEGDSTALLLQKIETTFRSFSGHVVAFSRWPIFRILWHFQDLHQDNSDDLCDGRVSEMKLGALPSHWESNDASSQPVDREIPTNSDGTVAFLDWGDLRSKVHYWTLLRRALYTKSGHNVDLAMLPEEARDNPEGFMFPLEVSIGSRFQLILASKANQVEAEHACPFGLHYLLVYQVAGACARLSQHLPPLAAPVDRLLWNVPFPQISSSGWPFWNVFMALEDLNKGNGLFKNDDVKYKRGYSDWNLAREELSPLTPSRFSFMSPSYYKEVSANVEALSKLSGAAYSAEAHRLVRRRETMDGEGLRPIVRNLVDAAITVAAATAATERKVAMVVLLYGEAWSRVLLRMVRRISQLRLKHPLLVVAIGELAANCCQRLAAGHKLWQDVHTTRTERLPTVVCWTPETPSQVHRFTVTNALLHMGVDVFYMDMDTFMVQNPVDPILKQADAGSFEALFAKHGDADCVNIGVFYLRATNNTALWMTQFVVWYHDHSFEIDQRGMHVFLGLPRVHIQIAWPPENLVKVNAGILEPTNEVVIGKTGWMGSYTRMTIFHWCSQPYKEKIVEMVQAYDAADALEEHGDGELPLVLALQAAPNNLSSKMAVGNEAWLSVQQLKRTLEEYRLDEWRPITACW